MAGISGATEGENKSDCTHERKRPKESNSEQLINGHGKIFIQSRDALGSDNQGQTTSLSMKAYEGTYYLFKPSYRDILTFYCVSFDIIVYTFDLHLC